MTIRQLLGIGSTTPAGGSAISRKGTAEVASTSITLPTHASGDYIFILANTVWYTSASDITVPSGWTELNRITTTTYQSVVGYKLATSGSEVSGTWTNADLLMAVSYDGVSAIGGSAKQSSSGSTIYWPGFTMTSTVGHSWVVGMGMITKATVTTPPTGMTNIDSFTRLTIHDTSSGVSAWNTKTTSAFYDSIGHAFTVELVSE